MSPPSPEALYHAIPRDPIDSNPDILPTDIELDGDEESGSDELSLLTGLTSDPPVALVDSRISWIHCVLGCAVLLPWNGAALDHLFRDTDLSGADSADHGYTFLCLSTCGLLVPNYFQLLSFNILHGCKFCLLSSCHGDVQAGRYIHPCHTVRGDAMQLLQTSPSRRIFVTTLWLSFLTLLLTISTFVHTGPGVFFAFVLLNGVAQAAAGSYLQTSVIAVASLFGPTAVQAVMSGQAAAAVVVSGVQVLSAAASIWGESREATVMDHSGGAAEERSAFIFFSLSTVFFLVSAWAQRWLATMPAYKAVVAPLEQEYGNHADRQGLVSSRRSEYLEEKSRILRVAKANLTYEIAVAYVFVVTLVCFELS